MNPLFALFVLLLALGAHKLFPPFGYMLPPIAMLGLLACFLGRKKLYRRRKC